MNFEESLQAQLDSDPAFAKSAAGRRLRRVLNAPPARKERALRRMEQHARVQLGKNQTERVDWGKVNAVDWGKIMELLMTLLPIILKIFGL